MMRTLGLWSVLLAVALTSVALAGEEPKKDDDKAIVGKVDDKSINRGDLKTLRSLLLAYGVRIQNLPNFEQLLDQIIDRTLWEVYLEEEGLMPTGPEVERAVKAFDARLRSAGRPALQAILAHHRVGQEDFNAYVRYQGAIAKRNRQIVDKITEDQIRKEYDANPAMYDGSRIRVSQIFVSTAGLGAKPKELEDAKKKIDECYAALEAGKDFARQAEIFSEHPASAAQGGDIGWLRRAVRDEFEELVAAAWGLEVGKHTKPIRTGLGWYIWKVTDKEPAYLTYFGCKKGIREALVRRKIKAMIRGFRDSATITKTLG